MKDKNKKEHEAFFRPTTITNRVVFYFSTLLRSKRGISEIDVEHFQKVSRESYENIGETKEILDKVINDTKWEISGATPPSNVWFGEAKFSKTENPEVIVYTESLAARLPTKTFFEHMTQAGMDHVFGHLSAFYAGTDFGEETACHKQHLVAKQRKTFLWRVISIIMPMFYYLHKKLPFKNFK